MSKQFEFRLIGSSAPSGELKAEHLLALVRSLRDLATSIGRKETDAQALGRAPRRVHRVADLVIGLAPGTTRLLARRAVPGKNNLDIDLDDELNVDDESAAVIQAIAADQRPPWIEDATARAAENLTVALQQAAPEVEFSLDGSLRRTFRTAGLRRATWQVDRSVEPTTVTFVGRLYAVNLNTHRLHVQDDVGHQVALPEVDEDSTVGRYLGRHVIVTGRPEYDTHRQLSRILDSRIAPADDLLSTLGNTEPQVISLDDILASAPGPTPGSGIDLSDEEFDAFMEAVRG